MTCIICPFGVILIDSLKNNQMYQNILQSQNIWKYSYVKDSEETKTQYIHDVVSRSARRL